MDIIAYTIPRYPKTDLLELAEIVVLIIPKPGIIKILNLTIQLTDVTDLEPTSMTQASKDPRWRQAISDEYDALVQNKTWELVAYDSIYNIVGCKWIYCTKYLHMALLTGTKLVWFDKGFH